MIDQFWKIGELAEQTGLTVRTLHHYDEIGLLSPSYRTTGDHRLYTADDVAKLQQIVSLKSLGFSLEQIKDALTKPEFAPEKVLAMQLDHTTKQMKLTQELQERLEGMQRFLQTRGSLTAQEFLDAIKLMQDVEGMYTDEEREVIRSQGEKIGKEGIISVEQEWPQLMAKMKAQLDSGAPANDPETLKLARRWKELVEMFTGGNPEIAAKLKDMYKNNPNAGKTFGGPGFDPAMFEYVGKAMEALGE
jgi:MerR family transcriptional regulator, thiopeptide resistance regulator